MHLDLPPVWRHIGGPSDQRPLLHDQRELIQLGENLGGSATRGTLKPRGDRLQGPRTHQSHRPLPYLRPRLHQRSLFDRRQTPDGLDLHESQEEQGAEGDMSGEVDAAENRQDYRGEKTNADQNGH